MKFIRRYKNEKFRPSFIRGQLQAGRGSMIVYSAFRSAGIGSISQLRGGFDSAKYIDLLNTVTRPYCRENMPPRFLYQQDNSPVHTAKIVKTWFKKNKMKILIFDWSAQSPDLNTTENLWSIVKKRISHKNPTNTHDVYESWLTFLLISAKIWFIQCPKDWNWSLK